MVSRKRNLELLMYHLEEAGNLIENEDIEYLIPGIPWKQSLSRATFCRLRHYVKDILNKE